MKEETKRYHASGLEIKEVQFANEVLLPEVVKMLNEGHTVTLRLRGFSMRPFLEDNRDKALLTKPIHSQEGDVVLAETGPRHYVLHRIVKIQGDNVTLRGDGNLAVERCKMADNQGVCHRFLPQGAHHARQDQQPEVARLLARVDVTAPLPSLSAGFLPPHLAQDIQTADPIGRQRPNIQD